MTARTDVTGYVLAGGQSRRMGQDKALLNGNGVPLVQAAVECLQEVCAQVAILSGPPSFDRDTLLSFYARLVPDPAAGLHNGPLAGLAVALADCPTEWALLLAVDQPAISAGVLHQLALAGTASPAAAACFVSGGIAEPLPLLASQSLGASIRHLLLAGERRLLPAVRMACAGLGRDLLQVAFPAAAAEAFVNLNTPDDLHRWQRAAVSNQSARSASETSNG